MDVCKRLRAAKTFENYMEISQDLANNSEIVQNIQFNMSTIIALKNVRSLEIEYFNKCDDTGAVIKVLERMFELPGSKIWHMLGKEVISLIQYWLDAVRKHLITHNINWWLFLKQLLIFVKQITEKHPSLNNILIEETAESLLDLATNGKLDVIQRHAVLHTFNIFSANSSREIRLGFRSQFEHYFIRLAAIMSSCGHLPTQYSIIETLLRWLLPRQDQALRRESANKWFPPHLYRQSSVDIFLDRQWINFIQDARDFLNSHNEKNELITSIICSKLSVGRINILSGTERRQSWLDINSTSRCMSILLDPLLLEAAGFPNYTSCEALVVSDDNVIEVKLFRETVAVTISATTTSTPQVLPSNLDIFGEERVVKITVSSRGDLLMVDKALRAVFQDKYQVLLDFDNLTCFSPITYTSAKRRSSRLHDRLAALPSHTFDKKLVSVCFRPELSDVTEFAESEYSLNSTTSTLKLRSSGYCHRKRYINDNRNSQSDSDLARNLNINQEKFIKQSQILKGSQSDAEDVIYKRDKPKDDRVNSSLFVATIGSTDESVINATLERIPKNKNVNTDNLIELLVREALKGKGNETEVFDSGINTGDGNKQDGLGEYSEAIDNTLQTKQKELTIVSKSTSDESNTEAINDTPMTYVNVRKRNLRKKSIVIDEEVVVKSPTYDVQTVEEFFSQHFTENKTGDLIISPTLAKKINVTSSETSEDFDQCLLSNDKVNIEKLQDMDIIECLNSIVDKVCNKFEKCTEYLEREINDCEILNLDGVQEEENNVPLHDISNSEQYKKVNERDLTKKSRGQGKRKIKLRYSMKKQKSKSKKTCENKLPLEPVSKMSTIVEVNTDTDVSITKDNTGNKANDSSDNKNNVNNSVIRRKRKLYSPKDDNVMYVENNESEKQKTPNDDVSKSNADRVIGNCKKENANAAMCYRELEKERQKYKRTRTRRSRCNIEAVSPKTKKLNDVFDNLKDTIEGEEKIMLADKKSAKDLTIFNYTSDSEDEDFKQKKIELQKRTNGRESSTDTYKKPNTKRKKTTKRNTRSKKIMKKELMDEKVRNAAPKTLDTSFVVEKEVKNKEDEHLIPVINAPEFETIPEDNLVIPKEVAKSDVEKTTIIEKSKGIKQIKKSKIMLVKKERGVDDAKEEVKLINNKDDERTISPLPGLLVETVKDKPNLDDSLPSNMIQKFKKVYQEGCLFVVDAFNETNVTNTTQNLLSDNDRTSPQMNITEEFNKIHGEAAKDDNTAKCTKISQDVKAIEILPLTYSEGRPRTEGKGSLKKTKRNLRLKSKIPSLIDNSVEDNVEKSASKIKLRINNLEDNLNTDKDIWSKMGTPKKQVQTIHVKQRCASLKSKTKENKQQIETLIISDVSEMKSEKSIATVGITAHGDLDELPPSSESLKIRHFPREVVDMDASIKEYYVKLHHQVNLNNTNSSKSKDNNDTRKKHCDEISIKTSTPQRNVAHIQRQNSKIWLRSQKNSSSSDEKSVSVSIPRISFNEISKWLPSSRNSPTDHDNSVPSLSNDDLRKCLPSPRSSNSEVSKKSSTKLPFKRPTTIVQREIASSQYTKRKSTISPIKLFDKLSTNTKYTTRNSTKTDTVTSSNTNDTARKVDTSVKKIITRSVLKESQESASKLNDSTSIKTQGVTLKYGSKKRTMETPIDVDVSIGPSVSSVDYWFKRNTSAVEQAENIGSSVKDIVQNIIEKLETTLSEIHQDTSKHFIHLFVDTQKQLSDLKSQQHDMYQQTATNILTRVRNIIDEEFMELDKRTQERDNTLTSWIKQQATEFIKQDCRKKRAMVQLLKEDAQAVLEYIKKTKQLE
ncbi:uncharacterized protein LOC113230284 [Hyposmocoma kahamanoa]|uniref:uncharacterized protein LOC113230284 n=1 Tax=Hyposmocoma kahamanoa TaxID=1477025 RepID=UPI000E6DA4F5|nr:uncharacterized protein LOC113230284 [Hyposmocoma kahamanoa]